MKRRILAAVMAVILAVTMLPADVYGSAGNVETPDSVAVVSGGPNNSGYYNTIEEAFDEANRRAASIDSNYSRIQIRMLKDANVNCKLKANTDFELHMQGYNLYSTASDCALEVDGKLDISDGGSIYLQNSGAVGSTSVIRVKQGSKCYINETDIINKNEDSSYRQYSAWVDDNAVFSIFSENIKGILKGGSVGEDGLFYTGESVLHDGIESSDRLIRLLGKDTVIVRVDDGTVISPEEWCMADRIEGTIKICSADVSTKIKDGLKYEVARGTVDLECLLHDNNPGKYNYQWYCINDGTMTPVENGTSQRIVLDAEKMKNGVNEYVCVLSNGQSSFCSDIVTVNKLEDRIFTAKLEQPKISYRGITYDISIYRESDGGMMDENGNLQIKAGDRLHLKVTLSGKAESSMDISEAVLVKYGEKDYEEYGARAYTVRKGTDGSEYSEDVELMIVKNENITLKLDVNKYGDEGHSLESGVYNGDGTHTGICVKCGKSITEKCSVMDKQCTVCHKKAEAYIETKDYDGISTYYYFVRIEDAIEKAVDYPLCTVSFIDETGTYNFSNCRMNGLFTLDLKQKTVILSNVVVGDAEYSDIKFENGRLCSNDDGTVLNVSEGSAIVLGKHLNVKGKIICSGTLIDTGYNELSGLKAEFLGNARAYLVSDIENNGISEENLYHAVLADSNVSVFGKVTSIAGMTYAQKGSEVKFGGSFCSAETITGNSVDIIEKMFIMPEESVKIKSHFIHFEGGEDGTEGRYRCGLCGKYFFDPDGMEEDTSQGKNECVILNRPIGGYDVQYNYNGSAIPSPVASQFMISNTDPDRKIEFVWRKNGEILNAAPSQTGEYTLTVIVYETEHFRRGEYTMKVTVKPVTPAGKVIVSYIDKNSNGILDTGDQLYADTSGIRPAPQSVKVDWLIKNGSDLRKLEADSSGRYTVKAYDKGEIFCVVRCEGSVAGSITSENRLILNKKNLKGDIRILGNPVYGNTLMITRPDEGILNKDYTVQWYCDGAAIFGENRETYVVRKSDEGKHLYARLVATENGNFTGILTSSQVTVAIRDVKPETPEITSFKTDFGKIRVYFQRVPSVQDKTMHYEISYKNLYGGSTSWRYATVGYNYLTLNNLVKNGKYEIKVRTYYWTDGRQKMHSEWSDGKIVYANRIGSSGQIMYKAGFTKVQAGNTSIKMNIKKVAFTKNPVRITYQIAYRKDKGSRYTGFKYVYTNNLNKTIYNLSRKTLYQVKVRYYYRSKVDNKLVFSDYTRIRFVKTK